MTVADRIKNKRIELDMTQKELSDKIGTKDRSSISKIEAKGDDITMKDIVRIASALGVTPQYLLGWEDDGIPVVVRRMPAKKDHSEAEALYELYKNASPEIQKAVEILLSSSKPHS